MPSFKMPNVPRALMEALSSGGRGADLNGRNVPLDDVDDALGSSADIRNGGYRAVDEMDDFSEAYGPGSTIDAEIREPHQTGDVDPRYEQEPLPPAGSEDIPTLEMDDLRAAEGDPELGSLTEPLQPNLPGIPRAQASGDELATKMESLPTEGPDAPSSLTALITRLEEMLGRRLSDDEYRLLLKQQPQPGTSAPTPDLPF